MVDISDEATTTEADASATADTNNNSSDGLHTSGPSNDPEDVMLKTWVTKKKPRKLGMSGPAVRTPVKRQRSDPSELSSPGSPPKSRSPRYGSPKFNG